ncbi:MAG TPA: tetratricopeptide repeat protein [Candidatus Binatia bacterium]
MIHKVRSGSFALLVAGITFIAFFPALRSGFSLWDDPENILNNPYYRGLGPAQLRWMFTTFLDSMYLPLTWLTLGTDYVFWGMHPVGYHLTSLAFHAAAAAVFYFVAVRLLAAAGGAEGAAVRTAAFVAALFFAVHPLRVETVAWASARGDVVAGFFAMLALLAYVKAAREIDRGRYVRLIAYASLFYALALLGKGAALALPLGLIVLDWYPLGRLGSRSAWIEKLPFFALSFAAGVLALYGKYAGGLLFGLSDFTMVQRLALTGYGLIFYLSKTAAPFGLAPLYPLPPAIEFSDPRFFWSVLAAVALTTALVIYRGRWPWALAAWLWHGALLLPTAGLLQNGPQLAADRYDYLAAPAAALLVGAAALYIYRRSAVAAVSAAAVIVVLFAALTWRQSELWNDPVGLWQRAVSFEPRSHLAQHYFASALLAAGKTDDALRAFEASKQLNPSYASAYLSIGRILEQRGDASGAIENYRSAARLFPASAAAHFSLATQLLKTGQRDEAIAEYRETLKLDPKNADAHNNLGFLLAANGEIESPREHFAAAIELNPRHALAYYNLGMLMLKTGDAQRAAEYFVRALELRPGTPEIERALAAARARQAAR